MLWAALTRRTTLGVALAVLIVSTATAAPAGGDATFMRSAERAVDAVEHDDGFSGAILVAHGDQVLLRKATGFSDRERNIRNTPETKFPIESVTKQFTAAAIMLLVEDGKVSLTDPISKHYPASPPAWKNVTIKHLLAHSSGMDDYWIRHPEARGALERGELFHSYQEIIQIALDDPLLFGPGTKFQYSNEGYALLTAVVERASGQTFADFLRARIFAPLTMRNTGYGTIPGNLIRGYVRSREGEWKHGDAFDFIRTTGGAGGVYSTLDDLLVWGRALETDKILTASSRLAMFTDYGFNYGFGWRFSPKFGRKLIWHTGGGGPEGFAAIFDRFPEEELTVLVMTNNTGLTDSTATLMIEGKATTFPANAARKLVEQIEKLYFGREP